MHPLPVTTFRSSTRIIINLQDPKGKFTYIFLAPFHIRKELKQVQGKRCAEPVPQHHTFHDLMTYESLPVPGPNFSICFLRWWLHFAFGRWISIHDTIHGLIRFCDWGFATLPFQSEYLKRVCLVPIHFSTFFLRSLLCRCIALHCREEFFQSFCTNSIPQTS